MTQGVLVKPCQDLHDLNVLWEPVLTLVWLIKLTSASFYSHAVIIYPRWRPCRLWVIHFHKKCGNMLSIAIGWRFLMVLVTADHSNPMFVWVGRKGDVTLLLHILCSFLMTFQRQLWMMVRLFLYLIVFPTVFRIDHLRFHSLLQKLIVGIILISFNQVTNLGCIRTYTTAFLWEFSNFTSHFKHLFAFFF